MDIGAAGRAILFFAVSLGMVMIGLFTLAYAARSYLLVVENTTAGADEVRWPDEPVYDWLWKGIYLTWIVAVWLGPAWLLIDGVIVPLFGLPRVGFIPVLAGVLWLLFPIGLFSSLSAHTIWVPFRWTIVKQFARQGIGLLVVAWATGLLVIGGSALGYLAVTRDTWLLLPLAAFAGSAMFLVHARLMGRFGYMASRGGKKKRDRIYENLVKMPQLPPEEPLPTPTPTAVPAQAPPAVMVGVPQEEDEWAPAKPYSVEPPREGPVATPPARLPKAAGYDLSDKEPPFPTAKKLPNPHDPDRLLPPLFPVDPRDLMRERESKPPEFPLWVGVYNFPWYPTTVHAWVVLSLTGMIVGLFLRFMVMTWPFGD